MRYFLNTITAAITLGLAFNVFAQRPFPESEGGVLVFYDQLHTSLSEEQVQFAAEHACGTQKVPLSFINRVRAYNPDFLLLHYELAFGAGDHVNLEGEVWVSDWDSINPHEDWFLHSSGGYRCHQLNWNWDFTDPSGDIEGAIPGWKEYWVHRAIRRMQLNHCDGIFADSHILPWNMDYYPAGYEPPNDVGLGEHFVIFDQYVMSQFHNDSTEYKFIPNVGQMITTRDTTNYSNCDGVMIELFSTYDCITHFEPSDWVLEVDRVLNLASMGKILIFQHDCDFWSSECRTWFLANYYMMKNSTSYINLILDPEGEWCDYGSFNPTWLAEYELDLGNFDGPIPSSAAEMYNSSWGVYARYYEGGMVLVNNSWSGTSVSFPEIYYRVSFSGGGCVGLDGSLDGITATEFTPTTGFILPEMTAAIVSYSDSTISIVEKNEEKNKAVPKLFFAFQRESVLYILYQQQRYSGSLRICNIKGRNVYSGECTSGQVNVEGFPAGVYFAIAPGLPPVKFLILQ